MIGLDTNVLVRFLARDDPHQSPRARLLIEREIAQDEGLFVADVVLCETYWVLTSAHKCARKEVANVFRELIDARGLFFESRDRLANALDRLSEGRGNFADYLILERSREAGCASVATFDRALLREQGFSPVQ